MLLLAGWAAFIGLVHSMAPGHWLPVVLMTKARKWPMRIAILGAATAAAGHILISIVLGLIGLQIETSFLTEHEHVIEAWSGMGLVVFGLSYAIWAFLRHSHCSGHEHHGPDPRGKHAPFVFLFSLGLSPCIAVLPVFVAAAPRGALTVMLTMLGFAVGVLTALIGGTVLVSKGIMKLDHPIFEHYGDVITGFGVALLGLILFLTGGGHGIEG